LIIEEVPAPEGKETHLPDQEKSTKGGTKRKGPTTKEE